jgi:hypothetical protein
MADASMPRDTMLAPTDVTVLPRPAGLLLTWTNPARGGDTGRGRTEIWGAASGDSATKSCLGIVRGQPWTTPQHGMFLVEGLPQDRPFWFWIRTIDHTAAVSAFVAIVYTPTAAGGVP